MCVGEFAALAYGFVGSDSLSSGTSGPQSSERRWQRFQAEAHVGGLDLLLTCETIAEAVDKNDRGWKPPAPCSSEGWGRTSSLKAPPRRFVRLMRKSRRRATAGVLAMRRAEGQRLPIYHAIELS